MHRVAGPHHRYTGVADPADQLRERILDVDSYVNDAKVRVLIENVRHHVQEEEEDLFPKVRERLSAERLEDLGEELEAAKSTVPTRPHPKAPDTPPGNLATGAVSAVTDRLRDRLGR